MYERQLAILTGHVVGSESENREAMMLGALAIVKLRQLRASFSFAQSGLAEAEKLIVAGKAECERDGLLAGELPKAYREDW